MELQQEILSEITTNMKYAKYLPLEFRRESWKEIVERNKEMHKKKFTHIQGFDEKIDYVYDNFVLTKKVLPSNLQGSRLTCLRTEYTTVRTWLSILR